MFPSSLTFFHTAPNTCYTSVWLPILEIEFCYQVGNKLLSKAGICNIAFFRCGNTYYLGCIEEYNTADGVFALRFNTTGDHNTATGNSALISNTTGYQNIATGAFALMSNTLGNYNTVLGCAAFLTGDVYSNSTALGYSANITASNQIRLGNSSITSIGGQVGWTTISDGRFKKDIKESVPGLAFLLELCPVTYHLDIDAIAKFHHTPDSLRLKKSEVIKSEILQTGFIAQEVEKAANRIGYNFSGIDKPKSENDHYGLRYDEFVVPLVKGMQEQQKMILEQKKIILKLEERIKALEVRQRH